MRAPVLLHTTSTAHRLIGTFATMGALAPVLKQLGRGNWMGAKSESSFYI